MEQRVKTDGVRDCDPESSESTCLLLKCHLMDTGNAARLLCGGSALALWLKIRW